MRGVSFSYTIPHGIDLCRYRSIHLTHHDSEWIVGGNIPRNKSSTEAQP
jgi:hypothetical protein